MKLLDHGLLEAERLKTKAYFALAQEFEPAGEGEYPVIMFNPNAYTLTENVECEFMLADQNWDPDMYSCISVLDDKGQPVKFQLIKEESNLNLDWRKRIMFEAEIPSLSMRRYSVYVTFRPTEEKKVPDQLIFDNGRKYVEIDSKTGLLKRYSIEGVDYVKDGFELYSFDDNADPWGMGSNQLKRMGSNGQPFELCQDPDGVFANMKSIQIIEDGDIYLGIEAFFEKDHTKARIGYKIYKNNDYVDVDVTLFFGDVDKIIKLKVPVCEGGRLIGQTAFGTEELFTDARENVAHRFVAVENGKNALTLMNTGVYGSHYEDGAIYMSLVRGATYCAHPIGNRPLIPSDRFTKKIDQGESNYSFRLGLVESTKLERATQEFVQRPYGLNIFPIPTENNKFLEFQVFLEDETVAVATIKKADGREAILFRLLNNADKQTETVLHVNDAKLPLVFGKYEVKTILYEDNSLFECEEMII